MGLETAALVMATVAVGAEVGKAGFEIAAEKKQQEALDLQQKEMKVQTQQKTLQNYDVLDKVINAQEAYMTTTGTSFSSPSFNAIQRNTENIAAKNQKNTELESNLADENINIEKENVRNTLFAQLFGDTENLAMSAFNVAGKAPNAGGTSKVIRG